MFQSCLWYFTVLGHFSRWPFHEQSVCLYLCIDSVCVLSLPSAAGGEIFDHCVSEELLPEAQITRLIRQTLEGVHQLHQSNLVHLDLKVCTHIQYTHTEN